ncbi:MAG TPA: hypothetical protein ENN29_10295 [Candidatus Hydrogenedentes bacterium]|nr:hypothetical protein [Candidatus Hydrogenedentota bacterium]
MKNSRTALMCLLGVFAVAGCQTGMSVDLGRITGSKLSDEEKIALVLEDVQRGMEGRRIYQVLAHVSRSYKDREGRDYEKLREDLNTLLRNYRAIKITRTPPRIRVQGDRARVIDTFGAIAESASPIEYPPMNLQGQVIIMMERFGDTWQIVEWGPIT